MSIFSRRKRRERWTALRYFIWPATGWKRAIKYSAYRVRRIDGSANSIAVGVAWGVAVSFTPFYFLHIGIAVAGSWFMGGSLLGAAIGTLVLNPLTFPLIGWLTYSIGSYFLASSTNFESMGELSMGYIVDNFSEIVMPFLLPMALGGFLVAFVSWIIVFLIVRILVSRYRELRIQRFRRKNLNR
jgi:uncharacterized protein (DUF2062 family)